jgi:hypothetical protein
MRQLKATHMSHVLVPIPLSGGTRSCHDDELRIAVAPQNVSMRQDAVEYLARNGSVACVDGLQKQNVGGGVSDGLFFGVGLAKALDAWSQ